MLFKNAIEYQLLPESDPDLKTLLNHNPPLKRYTARARVPGRSVTETDRGGWRGYDRVYTQYISNMKKDKFNLLEIGFYHGFGVLAWQRYFKSANIYSIDIRISQADIQQYKMHCSMYSNIRPATIHESDSTNSDDWCVFYGKQFDVIIDDADHHPTSQINTLNCAWEYLKPGGIYFIEDISHRYGEEPLIKLSDRLQQLVDEGHEITTYSHINTGLRYLIDNNRLRGITDKSIDVTEYITVVKKKH